MYRIMLSDKFPNSLASIRDINCHVISLLKDSFTLTLKFLDESRWCGGRKITSDSKRNIDKNPCNAYLLAQPSDTRRVFAYRTHMSSCATSFSSFHPAFGIFHKYAVLLRKEEPLVLAIFGMHIINQYSDLGINNEFFDIFSYVFQLLFRSVLNRPSLKS